MQAAFLEFYTARQEAWLLLPKASLYAGSHILKRERCLEETYLLSHGCCTNLHSCAPVPLQSKIWSCTPFATEAPGTSKHRPLPRPTNLKLPFPRETGCHC